MSKERVNFDIVASDFLSSLVLQKMKADNFNQLDNYDKQFCERQYTHGFCYISLFIFQSFDQFIPQDLPQILDICSVVVLQGVSKNLL